MIDTQWHRRNLLRIMAGTTGIAALSAVGLSGASRALASSDLDTSTVIDEDGFITQDWFLESFLDLSEDFDEAADEGKRLAIIWEQKGCPYCREMHLVNFSTPSIRDWIRERYTIVQLDIWGSREVTDFDGDVLEERDFSQKSQITFTPTIQFFPSAKDAVAGKSGRDAEVARMPGYFRRFHFMTMFEYVHEEAYEKEDFQRYLVAKLQRMQENGEPTDVW